MAKEVSAEEQKRLNEDIERLRMALQGQGDESELEDSEDEDGRLRVATESEAVTLEVDALSAEESEAAEEPKIPLDWEPQTGLTSACLALNRAYQEIIRENLDCVQIMLTLNREKQMALDESLTDDSTKQTSKTQTKFSMFTMPYFKTNTGMCPPPNPEQVAKVRNGEHDIFEQFQKIWSPDEIRVLRECVKEAIVTRLKQPLLTRRGLEEEKLRDAVKEEDKESLRESISRIEQEIEIIDAMPDEVVYTNDQCLDDALWMTISNVEFSGEHSPMNCELTWRNVAHTELNRGRWSKAEDEKLIALVAKFNMRNWVQVAAELQTGRNAFQCLQRYQNKLNPCLKMGKWSAAEDEALLHAVESNNSDNGVKWSEVVPLLGGRSREQCVERWELINTSRVGTWSQKEDIRLMTAVELFGTNDWVQVQKFLGTRNLSQCKGRWNRHLDPSLQFSAWTPKEDKHILTRVEQLGVGQWKTIASELPGRSNGMVLCRYKKLMQCKRQAKFLRNAGEEEEDYLVHLMDKYHQARGTAEECTERARNCKDTFPEVIELPPRLRQRCYTQRHLKYVKQRQRIMTTIRGRIKRALSRQENIVPGTISEKMQEILTSHGNAENANCNNEERMITSKMKSLPTSKCSKVKTMLEVVKDLKTILDEKSPKKSTRGRKPGISKSRQEEKATEMEILKILRGRITKRRCNGRPRKFMDSASGFGESLCPKKKEEMNLKVTRLMLAALNVDIPKAIKHGEYRIIKPFPKEMKRLVYKEGQVSAEDLQRNVDTLKKIQIMYSAGSSGFSDSAQPSTSQLVATIPVLQDNAPPTVTVQGENFERVEDQEELEEVGSEDEVKDQKEAECNIPQVVAAESHRGETVSENTKIAWYSEPIQALPPEKLEEPLATTVHEAGESEHDEESHVSVANPTDRDGEMASTLLNGHASREHIPLPSIDNVRQDNNDGSPLHDSTDNDDNPSTAGDMTCNQGDPQSLETAAVGKKGSQVASTAKAEQEENNPVSFKVSADTMKAVIDALKRGQSRSDVIKMVVRENLPIAKCQPDMPPLPPTISTMHGFKTLLLSRSALMVRAGRNLLAGQRPRESGSNQDDEPGDTPQYKRSGDKLEPTLDDPEQAKLRPMNLGPKTYNPMNCIKQRDDYKRLRARFRALFLWPALLSTTKVRQMDLKRFLTAEGTFQERKDLSPEEKLKETKRKQSRANAMIQSHGRKKKIHGRRLAEYRKKVMEERKKEQAEAEQRKKEEEGLTAESPQDELPKEEQATTDQAESDTEPEEPVQQKRCRNYKRPRIDYTKVLPERQPSKRFAKSVEVFTHNEEHLRNRSRKKRRVKDPDKALLLRNRKARLARESITKPADQEEAPQAMGELILAENITLEPGCVLVPLGVVKDMPAFNQEPGVSGIMAASSLQPGSGDNMGVQVLEHNQTISHDGGTVTDVTISYIKEEEGAMTPLKHEVSHTISSAKDYLQGDHGDVLMQSGSTGLQGMSHILNQVANGDEPVQEEG